MLMTGISNRGVVQITGPDAASFLNGLLTNEVAPTGLLDGQYAALLTPQGKFLFDMFLVQPSAEVFLLDTSRPQDLVAHLTRYKLRAKVTIEDASDDFDIVAFDEPIDLARPNYIYVDCRHEDMAFRAIVPKGHGFSDDGSYLAYRLERGVPDPAVDMIVEKDFLLEGLFDELNGVDFQKGCYVGQEMTSRMKRRTTVRNKLCRVRLNGPLPAFGTPIEADGWEVGQIRSGLKKTAIAMIRFDRARKAEAEGKALMAGETEVTLDPPDWLIEPDFTPAAL